MKFRNGQLDDVHLEALFWLDNWGGPWSRSLRVAVNVFYWVHRKVLVWLIALSWKRSILNRRPERSNLA